MKRKVVYVQVTWGGNIGENEVDRLKREGWIEVDRIYLESHSGRLRGETGWDRYKVILEKEE